MQTYLCVVHPIYQEDEQALQTQTKKERKGERERTKLLQLFSYLSSSKKKQKKKQLTIQSTVEWRDTYELGSFILYSEYAE